MEFNLAITAAQAAALGKWVVSGDEYAQVLLRLDQASGNLYVGQGDDRAVITDVGDIVDAA